MGFGTKGRGEGRTVSFRGARAGGASRYGEEKKVAFLMDLMRRNRTAGSFLWSGGRL